MENYKKIIVFIVDDCKRDVRFLKEYLEKIPRVQLVLVFKNAKELFKELKETTPDLILMDVRMDIMNGIEATLKVMKLNKKIKVIACSGHNDELSVLMMLKAGASGYLDKNSIIEDYDNAINTVMKDEIYFNINITKKLYKKAIEELIVNKNIFGTILNEMQIKVGRFLCKGMGYKQIGEEVNRSETSIPKYKREILDIIGSENDLDIPRYFLRHKLIFPHEL